MEIAERPRLARALIRVALLLGGTVLFFWQLPSCCPGEPSLNASPYSGGGNS
jgi:hypothetical protein